MSTPEVERAREAFEQALIALRLSDAERIVLFAAASSWAKAAAATTVNNEA